MKTSAELRPLFRNLCASVVMAEQSARNLAVGRPVRILTGPYKGYVAETCVADVARDHVWIGVDNIERKDKRGFIEFSTRKDGRTPYRIEDLEFLDTDEAAR